MAQKYSVDWSDPSHPTIVPDEMVAYPDGYTLTEAKQRVYLAADMNIGHWRAIKAQVRLLRAADITRATD